MRKTLEEERDFMKRPCILNENSTLGQFSVSACVNQPPGFDSKLVIPNNQWGKRINALLQTTPLTIGCCIEMPFENRNS